ncbi:MAG: acetolactate synthase large subunit, partial [Desulfamplus sp.]|nr:acetolactate synthase large subunit [Desulfamplus sp.]
KDKFASNAKIVQIDIDPTSIHKNVEATCPIVGDCKNTLELLTSMLEAENPENIKGEQKERQEWLDQISQWRATSPQRYEQVDNVIKPQYVIDRLHKLTDSNTIITTEVGQNQMWTAQYYHFERPNQFITSGGLGVMGFGLPAAIGAKAACPDKLVVCVAGDGSIQMNSQELMTAIESNLDVKIVILNNRYLGMVRQWQELFYDRRYSYTNMEQAPDFVKLAEAYGAVGIRTDRFDEVESVLKKGLESKGTVIMDFIVDREECVYPMVPAGGAITEMILV